MSLPGAWGRVPRAGAAGAAGETIGKAADRAVAKVVAHLRGRSGSSAADHRRLAELGVEIENATRLAVKSGEIDAVSRVLAELEQERLEIERRIPPAEPIEVDLYALRARVDRYACDLRAAFDRAPEQGRVVLERLLAGRRMTVHAEADCGFRVEGLFDLCLETASARPPECDRATRFGGSGGLLHACCVDLPVRIAA